MLWQLPEPSCHMRALQPCFRGWYVRANISRRCFAPRAPQTALHCTARRLALERPLFPPFQPPRVARLVRVRVYTAEDCRL
jgi:hypothetical protein